MMNVLLLIFVIFLLNAEAYHLIKNSNKANFVSVGSLIQQPFAYRISKGFDYKTNSYFFKNEQKMSFQLASNDESESLNDEMKAKLKAEMASPFYRVRQFLYIAGGSAGALGTLTTIPQIIIASTNGGDISTAVTNVAIDIGLLVAAVLLWNYDSSNQNKKLSIFVDKQKKQSNAISSIEAKQNEDTLKLLPIEIPASVFNESITKIVSFGDLQSKGKQNVVIFAGDKEFVRDSVISARITGIDEFQSKETLIVPIEMTRDKAAIESSNIASASAKGFGPKEDLFAQPYIARAAQFNLWEQYMQREIVAAEKQGGASEVEDIMFKGIVLVVRSNGKIIRRGIGIPPWKTILAEIEESNKNKSKK